MRIETLEQLEDAISEPSRGVIDALSDLDGDIIVLGAGGKMGPSLTRMAKRACDAAGLRRRVIAVSRFSSADEESKLRFAGVETIRCDLLDADQVSMLPDAPNVVFMAGQKFGTTGQQALTWAINAYVPGVVCSKYRASKIVAFSTGNVYPLSPIQSGGCVEADPTGPIGEYAMSALGRERVFEHFSRSLGTPTAIIRLNYAVELRYGVLVDIARRVFAGEPIDVANGYFNVIWQGDANAIALMAFAKAQSPPFVLNMTGLETLSVRKTAETFGKLMGKSATFHGVESPDALLSNAKLSEDLFGPPQVSVDQMMKLIAAWIMRGGESHGKPTHFETRDGKF